MVLRNASQHLPSLKTVDMSATPTMNHTSDVHPFPLSDDTTNTSVLSAPPLEDMSDSATSSTESRSPVPRKRKKRRREGLLQPKRRNRDPTMRLVAEFRATRSLIDRITDLIAQETENTLPLQPLPRTRIGALCSLIADRFMALSPSLQLEFAVKVLTLLMEFTRQSENLRK